MDQLEILFEPALFRVKWLKTPTRWDTNTHQLIFFRDDKRTVTSRPLSEREANELVDLLKDCTDAENIEVIQID